MIPIWYSVSRSLTRTSGRPYPSENRSTFTSRSFAATKWPSSWISTSSPTRSRKYRIDIKSARRGYITPVRIPVRGFEGCREEDGAHSARRCGGDARHARQGPRSPEDDVRAVLPRRAKAGAGHAAQRGGATHPRPHAGAASQHGAPLQIRHAPAEVR